LMRMWQQYLAILLAILLYGIDIRLIGILKQRIAITSYNIQANLEDKLIDFLLYSISIGTLSIRLALKVLGDLAKKSNRAWHLQQKIKIIIKEQNTVTRTYEGLFMRFLRFNDIAISDPRLTMKLTSKEIENFLSSIESMVDRFEELMALFLFALFFIPAIITQLALLTGNFQLVIILPLVGCLLSVYILSHLERLTKETPSAKATALEY